MHIAKQMNDMYGLDISAKDVSIEDSAVRIWHDGMFYSYAYIDKKGNILSDSYVHVYYAEDEWNEANSLFSNLDSEYVLVHDYMADPAMAYSYLDADVKFGSINSYEEYMERYENLVMFDLYLRADVDDAVVDEIERILVENEGEFWVSVIKVSDEWFDKLNDAQIRRYIGHYQVLYDLGYEVSKEGYECEDADRIFMFILNPVHLNDEYDRMFTYYDKDTIYYF